MATDHKTHLVEFGSVEFGRIAPGIPVTDINRSVEFYTRILGMTKTFENGDPIGFVIVEKDRAEIHLTLKKDHVASDGERCPETL